MISKAIEGSITKIYLKKIILHRREYEWANSGGVIRNDGPTMLYLLFKIMNPATRIDFLNLKYDIDKSILSNFFSNVKNVLNDMSSN